MKKILSFRKEGDDYIVGEGSKLILKISLSTLTINGTDLFNNLFIDINLDEKLEITVTNEVKEPTKNEERLYAEFSKIVNSIVVRINDRFHPEDPEIELLNP